MRKLQKEANLGFQAQRAEDLKDLDKLHEANKGKVQEDLKQIMRPELLNRIDKIVVFRALTKMNIERILDNQITELRDRLIKHGVGIRLTKSAKNYLMKHGYDAKNGARPMRRLIEDTIEDHIALEILSENYYKGDVIRVSAGKDKLLYKPIREQKGQKQVVK